MATRTVPTGAGVFTLTRDELQHYRLFVRTEMDKLENRWLRELPSVITDGKTDRARELIMRGFTRCVLYGHED